MSGGLAYTSKRRLRQHATGGAQRQVWDSLVGEFVFKKTP
jgi:hypothetical protein